MASGTSRGWTLKGDLQGNLATFDGRAKLAMVAGANYVNPQIIAAMRSGAPWQDQTGAARSGLDSQVQVDGDSVRIIAFHRVPYGVYLETRWSGRYQIIRPVLQEYAPKVLEAIGKLLFK